MYVKFWKLC